MPTAGVPLLFDFIMLGFGHADSLNLAVPQELVFDYPSLLQTKLPHSLETIVFFLLLCSSCYCVLPVIVFFLLLMGFRNSSARGRASNKQ